MLGSFVRNKSKNLRRLLFFMTFLSFGFKSTSINVIKTLPQVGMIKKRRKDFVSLYLFMFISLVYPGVSISVPIQEPPVAAGFLYARQAADQYLYPNPDELGQRACSDINATQTPDQLRIFGPIVFSRSVVSPHATTLSVYCTQNGSEWLANGFPGAGAISGWYISCAPGASPDSQTTYTIDKLCIRSSQSVIPKKNFGQQSDFCSDNSESVRDSINIGNPINSAIGNKIIPEIDYKGALDTLIFKRFYNSQNIATLWRHNYQNSLQHTIDPIVFSASSIVFTWKSGQYVPDDIVIPTSLTPRVVITKSDGMNRPGFSGDFLV